MPGRGFTGSTGYRYGFNGKEKDDEIKGSGNSLDFGERIYDSRLGRFLSVDPKSGQNATWSPYAFAVDNPIVFIDVEGEWPGITFVYFEFDVGAGLGYGLNYVEQSGIAYDEVGKTHFTMTSALYIVNQQLEESSSNPQLIAGASIGLTGNVKLNWSAETFGGLVGKGGLGLPIPINADIGLGVAINAGFNGDEFVLGAGFGVGVKISHVNTSIKQSISLTDKQASDVNDATDVVAESWIITGQTAVKDKSGNVTGYQASVSTRNTKGALIDTGIKVNSGVNKDAKGNTSSNGVWSSGAYQKEAAQAEKEDSE